MVNFSFLSDAYRLPSEGITNRRRDDDEITLTNEYSLPSYTEAERLKQSNTSTLEDINKNFKNFQKLKITSRGDIEIDNRISIIRTFSDDNRWKTLVFLNKYYTDLIAKRDYLGVLNFKELIMKLINTTYSKDTIWKEQANQMINHPIS